MNLPIGAADLDGVYINLETGVIESEYPVDFEDGPWINFSLGGNAIFNGDPVRPIATTPGSLPYYPENPADYYINVSEGISIDDSSAFVVEGFASINHVGTEGEPGKFVPGEAGILGFEFTKTADSSVHYGWMRIIVGPSGEDGTVVDWAYENSPDTAIAAGAVPEPSMTAMLAVAFLGGTMRIRRRVRR